ncbi:MAG: UTP--glucose-1-phosphate uridylyltransferase [Gammaproteobacteria bacterium]|nr:UTP--glucose-1-phosphate uridylyltransferase [Gammaproteobacteria bacterium]
MQPITKAIIPVAGFGTRFLPATKAIPKELFPLLDAPVIHYVVEEAVNSGITDIALITSERKTAIQQYFSVDSVLEKQLESTGRLSLLERVKKIGERARISYITQPEQKGLGDAVYMGRSFVGDESFVVMLGDAVMLSQIPVTQQLLDVYGDNSETVIGVERIDRSRANRYGIIDPHQSSDPRPIKDGFVENRYKINDLIEKPALEKAPSNLAIAGRYILPNRIFDFLAQTKRGTGNEIQLTDAIRLSLKHHEAHAFAFQGTRYDIGNKLDFIRASLAFGLEDPEMRDALMVEIQSKVNCSGTDSKVEQPFLSNH